MLMSFLIARSGMPFLLNKVKIINGIKTLPIFKTQPYFDALGDDLSIEPLKDLKVLAKFGDTVTTDHISPAAILPEIVQQLVI